MPRSRAKRRSASLQAPVYPHSINSIGDFFAVIDGLLRPGQLYWYRGHGNPAWTLTPSALRPRMASVRKHALALHHDFRRLSVLRLRVPPPADDELQWIGLAQHYGLPTRLLDWTENPAIALYFATLEPTVDGRVYILNPLDLNRRVDRRDPRVFDAGRDRALIRRYFELGATTNKRGRPTIAINPVYNSERILLQRGAFTLHGDRSFSLNASQAPSLVAIAIPQNVKAKLAAELARIGIYEMSMFPEPEHICTHLRRGLGL